MNVDHRKHLVQLLEEDNRIRAELAATGELFEGYAPRMAEVHNRNARELAAIIDEFGWPGKTRVGEDGAEAAWLILQHAIGNPELQRKCLPLLHAAVANGEADARHAAMLEDRICFFERRPQCYGTQFDWDEDGRMSPWLIEDPEDVDERRRAVGLEPLAKAIQRIEEQTKREDEKPPMDYQKRQEEMLAWAKSVGWLA